MNKLRRATLYSVVSEEVMAGDTIEVLKIGFIPQEALTKSFGNISIVRNQDLIVERLPIYHVRECGKDQFIAINPELRDILETPYKEGVRLAHEVMEKERAMKNEYFARMLKSEGKINDFRYSSTLWQRLKMAWSAEI